MQLNNNDLTDAVLSKMCLKLRGWRSHTGSPERKAKRQQLEEEMSVCVRFFQRPLPPACVCVNTSVDDHIHCIYRALHVRCYQRQPSHISPPRRSKGKRSALCIPPEAIRGRGTTTLRNYSNLIIFYIQSKFQCSSIQINSRMRLTSCD